MLNMLSIREVVNSLSQREIDLIISSPTIQEAFIEDAVLEHGFDKSDLEEYFRTEYSNIKEEQTVVNIPLKVVKPTPQWDKGETFIVKHRKATLMNEILEVLQETNGISKTAILLKLGKDNVSWRKIFTDVSEYMLARGNIKKISTKYYLSNQSVYRECEFHRELYALLYEGPKTTTYLMKKMRYNNPKGRVKVLQALNMMVEEKIVQKESRYWCLLD